MIVIKGIIKDEESVLGENRYTNLENPKEPTLNDIQIMDNYLKNNSHTKVIYITASGQISLAKFQYTGGFVDLKEHEGKFYSRLDIKSKMSYSTSKKKDIPQKFYIPVPSCEIVGEYTNKGYVKHEVKRQYSLQQLQEKYESLIFDNYKQKYY